MGHRRCRTARVRSRPEVPEPPRCRRRRSRSRRRRSPLLPALRRCLPYPPGRHRGARPGEAGGCCALPTPLPGRPGPGLRLGKNPDFRPPRPDPCCSGESALSPPSLQSSSTRPKPRLLQGLPAAPPAFSPLGAVTSGIPGSAPQHPPALTCTALPLTRPLSSTCPSVSASGVLLAGCPPQLSPLRGGDEPPPPPPQIPQQQHLAPPRRHSPIRAPLTPPEDGGLPAPPKQVSPPFPFAVGTPARPPDHLCCGQRLLCPGLCSCSNRDPRLRAGRDAKGALGWGEG